MGNMMSLFAHETFPLECSRGAMMMFLDKNIISEILPPGIVSYCKQYIAACGYDDVL